MHEYWVTLYLIGEAKFEEAAAALAVQPSSKCEREQEDQVGEGESSLKGPPNPPGRVRVMASPLQFRKQ